MTEAKTFLNRVPKWQKERGKEYGADVFANVNNMIIRGMQECGKDLSFSDDAEEEYQSTVEEYVNLFKVTFPDGSFFTYVYDGRD